MKKFVLSVGKSYLTTKIFNEADWEVSPECHKKVYLDFKLNKNDSLEVLREELKDVPPGAFVLVDAIVPRSSQLGAIAVLERQAHAFMAWVKKSELNPGESYIKEITEMPFSHWLHSQALKLPPPLDAVVTGNQADVDVPSLDEVAAPRLNPHELLNEIIRLTSWNDFDSDPNVQFKVEQLTRLGDEWGERAREALLVGKSRQEAKASIDSLLKKYCGMTEWDSEEIQRGLAEILVKFNNAPSTLKQLNYYIESKKDYHEKIKIKRATLRKTQYKNHDIEHRIHLLAPSSKWTIYIDETGEDFSDGNTSSRGKVKKPGKVVAILIPKEFEKELQPLTDQWHATGMTSENLDEAFQQLLDLPVGILGIPNTCLRELRGDHYTALVSEMIAMILRFLPVDQDTTLEVLAEERGLTIDPIHWEPVRSELLRQLRDADPVRVNHIQLSIRTIPKHADDRLGYADLIANSWGSMDERFRLSKLGTFCLDEETPRLLSNVWQQLGAGHSIDPTTWRKLVHIPDALDSRSLPGSLLERLKVVCREDGGLWERYASETLRHLESKAVHLMHLHTELAWLRDCTPSLAPKLELAFLVSQLALSNHTGQVFNEQWVRIQELSEALYEEDAELCCYADLHLAVSCTNRFAFDEARAVLVPWGGVAPTIPGLQMWARVQSSLGQLEAFEGRFRAAIKYFDRALAAFSRLSVPSVAAGERRQTGTYRAIVLMDDPSTEHSDVLEAINVITGPFPHNISRLATSALDADKYAHHVLLRFLALHPTGKSLREHYLDVSTQWSSGEGHPWELIEFYRALILSDHREQARTHFKLAIQIATNPSCGPTTQWIGHVISEIAIARGFGILELPEEGLPLWENMPLPLSPIDLPDYLAAFPLKEVLDKVLPFNFH